MGSLQLTYMHVYALNGTFPSQGRVVNNLLLVSGWCLTPPFAIIHWSVATACLRMRCPHLVEEWITSRRQWPEMVLLQPSTLSL